MVAAMIDLRNLPHQGHLSKPIGLRKYLWCLIANVALASVSSPGIGSGVGSSNLAAIQGCPDVCTVGKNEWPGGGCALITFTEGPAEDGTATTLCAATCTLCKMRINVEWDCTACPGGQCTWVWGSLSYGRDGLPWGPGLAGSGTGSGTTSTTLHTSCGGPSAFWAISIAGATTSVTVFCDC